MEFSDRGIILDARAHGETHAIVHAFTETHGRWAGLVYGGQGRRMTPVLQAGNEVALAWKARNDDSLGHFSLELTRARAGELMQERLALAGLAAAAAVAFHCLPEREAHPAAYAAMTVLLENLSDVDVWPALMARWELGLLAELGFALSLDRCAATGSTENLIYVSPKSARAVSAEAGAPYHDRLLPLPAFLRGEPGESTLKEALDALKTTGVFIETRILHLSDKQLPDARRHIVELLRSRNDLDETMTI
ncbi:MAG: DNA repair protein RecO [Pseudomonadota bacterium]